MEKLIVYLDELNSIFAKGFILNIPSNELYWDTNEYYFEFNIA